MQQVVEAFDITQLFFFSLVFEVVAIDAIENIIIHIEDNNCPICRSVTLRVGERNVAGTCLASMLTVTLAIGGSIIV